MEYMQEYFVWGNTSYSLLAYEEIYVDKEKLENDTHESVWQIQKWSQTVVFIQQFYINCRYICGCLIAIWKIDVTTNPYTLNLLFELYMAQLWLLEAERNNQTSICILYMKQVLYVRKSLELLGPCMLQAWSTGLPKLILVSKQAHVVLW